MGILMGRRSISFPHSKVKASSELLYMGVLLMGRRSASLPNSHALDMGVLDMGFLPMGNRSFTLTHAGLCYAGVLHMVITLASIRSRLNVFVLYD